MRRVVVIGAGLIGAAIARRLADREVAVTLLEASRPAGGTSLATFAWVNALGKKPQAYFELNLAGMAEHTSLVRELGGGWHHPSGHLEWSPDPERIEMRVELARSAGYAGERLGTSAARQLEPDAIIGDDDAVAHYPDEAWVDPVLLARRLIAHPGITLRIGEAVDLATSGSRVTGVVVAGGETLEADDVVIATGPRAAELSRIAGLDLPMRHAPGLLAITEPAPVRVERVLHAPDVAIRPDGAGRLMLASDELDKRIEPSGGDLPAPEAADELLARARRSLGNLDRVRIEAIRIGLRAVTTDGLPAIGPLPGCEGAYLTVTHSGVTLGPLLGRLVAGELIDGVPNPLLDPYRPDRFGTGTVSD